MSRRPSRAAALTHGTPGGQHLRLNKDGGNATASAALAQRAPQRRLRRRRDARGGVGGQAAGAEGVHSDLAARAERTRAQRHAPCRRAS